MIKLDTLNSRIAESGITKVKLAKDCKMSHQAFYNKLDGKSDFTASEIYDLSRALHLSNNEIVSIFFCM